ncbi:MAG: DegT/DnrJ/EryC1/StrS family aminotransferase [bacterium]|nr:DegT/DnrJ/EryC1/StrS family aminotransferase [bacterium]
MAQTIKPSNAWRFKGNELKYLREVLRSGLSGGPAGSMNARFEEAFTNKFGAKYAITTNSGTAALHQTLTAFGVAPGDEVITPPLTPFMCTSTILMTGATPVYADVDPETFLIDPKDIERKITSRTKAIIAVHTYGGVCDMEAIMDIAKKHNLYVLEDCAECFLGKDKKGRIAGTIGHAGSFSFQATKHMTTGDGGIILTNDEQLAERIRKFGNHGFINTKAGRRMVKAMKDVVQDPDYLRHNGLGYNYRFSEILAAVGLAQLERLDIFVENRIKMAQEYAKAMRGVQWLHPQKVAAGETNSYFTFAVRLGEKIDWREFRKKYMELGGDGIYAAWALAYREPASEIISQEGRLFPDIPDQGKYLKGYLRSPKCPAAENLQPKMLQFTTNQQTAAERKAQVTALKKTIAFFESRPELA